MKARKDLRYYDLRATQVNAGREVRIAPDQGEKLHSVRPAADFFFNTAARIYDKACKGLGLTGMGSDDALGARVIKDWVAR